MFWSQNKVTLSHPNGRFSDMNCCRALCCGKSLLWTQLRLTCLCWRSPPLCEWLTWAQDSQPAAVWWHPTQTGRQCHSHGEQKPGWKQSSLPLDASSWRTRYPSHSAAQTHAQKKKTTNSECSLKVYAASFINTRAVNFHPNTLSTVYIIKKMF